MTIAKGGVVTRKIVAQYIEIPNVSPNESSPSTSEATLMQNVERPVAVTTEKAEDQTVGYRCRDFEDKYYHFRLKTPCFNSEGYKGISYYVERLGDKAEFLITHFNEGQESELYNASEMDTAISALTELHDGKVGKFILDMCGMTLDDCHLETDERIIAGLDAVRFTGIYYFESFGGYWSANAVGYCIRGKHTPVLLVAIDMSAAQDHLSELSAIIDEMAGTYIDGTGLD